MGPHRRGPSDLIAYILYHLPMKYIASTENIDVFDKYQDVPAKDHERMRRDDEAIIDMSSPTQVLCQKRRKPESEIKGNT